MGATGWEHFTPYSADYGQALQLLRGRVFESGEFGQARSVSELPPDAPANLRESLSALHRLEQARFAGARSIEELLERGGEGGTHSILDILHISNGPGFAVAWPAPLDTVRDVYGTDKPTRMDIERVGSGALEAAMELERWQAMFLIVYDQDRPSELYFEGVSGD